MAKRKRVLSLTGSTFGERLRSLRKHHELTPVEAAKRLGVSRTLYYYYESDARQPRASNFPAIAKKMGTTVNALYGVRE